MPQLQLIVNMSAKRKATDSLGMPSKRTRKVLTVAEKISVIDTVQAGWSHRAVAIRFNVGCTQVNQIMANKDSITAMYTDGMNATFEYLAPRNMMYPEIDTDVCNFFCIAHSKNMPINGPMLQSEANKSALKHNFNNFTASSDWLRCFCK